MLIDQPANPTISAIEPGKRRGRFNIYVDGVFAAAAGEKVIADLGLRLGQEFSPERLKRVAEAEESRRALENALRLLDERPRAKSEIEQRLRLKGYEDDVIAGVISSLKKLEMVDDAHFAKLWVESRGRANPKGARLLRAELAQKGVAQEDIDQAVGGLAAGDEIDLAKRALADKIKPSSMPQNSDEQMTQYKRWAGFLQRRGFGWETVKQALAEVLTDCVEEDDASAEQD